MSRIKQKFDELKSQGQGALVGYLTLGDPNPEDSRKLAATLCKNVDILEMGVPFSDPIADGPTIQAAIDRSLKAGMDTDKAFDIVDSLRKDGINTPFVFMTYYNIVLQYGEERFLDMCNKTGVDGILVSDMPLEESEMLLEKCRARDIDFIFLIAPTTTEERVKKIVKEASGFIYLVSLLGTTGARETLQTQTIDKTRWALEYTGDKPLVVGFGISKEEHVRAIIQAGAQGVVVGSAFVSLIGKDGAGASGQLEKLSIELKKGTI